MQLKIEHSTAFCISIYTPIGKLGAQFDELVHLAGGCTKTVGNGAWIDEDGVTINEPVCITQIILEDNGDHNEDAQQALFVGALSYLEDNPNEKALLVLVDDKKVMFKLAADYAVSEPA